MRVVLIGSFPTSVAVYQQLFQMKLLQAVCFQQQDFIDPITLYWKNGIESTNIPVFEISNKNITLEFKNFLKNQLPDLVLVCGFGLKIPSDLLNIPKYGFLNIHFGQLPQNRGADPVFWSLKNGDKQTAITIHKIDNDWDTGAILLEHKVPVFFGETYGILYTKMSLLLGSLMPIIVQKCTNEIFFAPQIKTNANYNNKPNPETLTINWENQTATEIEQLVNATNPKYGGATTYYQGGVVKILEAVFVKEKQIVTNKIPGEIVYSNPNEGLFVFCKKEEWLNIRVMNTDAGILSGKKYVDLGIQTGHFFTTNINN